MAVGSVSTLAAGALLLGAAPYLFNRVVGPTQSAPWGSISSLSVASPAIASVDTDRAQLLKLAALKTGATQADDETEKVQAVASAVAQPADVSPAVLATEPVDATSQAASSAPASNDAPVKIAAVDPDQGSRLKQDKTAVEPAGSTLININTASTEVLDHLPGAGRIGHAIVTHRPYRAVGDLVRKRVLRTSDFQKIQSVIRVD
ncbi:helix-hairpin-helix domain-containing protein [Lichenifustis flavocetrariae]|uniref:Helix-hairpin-helix domain-containing protein n=1 Tax=Lichenifustis flavocetrariae TaxID=2949735 RepID=A0AA41Z5Q0_9HYPH|nr:helix-hairpin-helix domain-containing protein [Lichenifustis flavocetrariae]MCW6509762.1 helix-hairpin-helix domain-containing protein [Lichenifustis flavocetrariae]